MWDNVAGRLKTYGCCLWIPFRFLFTWHTLSVAWSVFYYNWKMDKIPKSKYSRWLPCNYHPLAHGCHTTAFPALSHPHLWSGTLSVYSAWSGQGWLSWMRYLAGEVCAWHKLGSFIGHFNSHLGFLSLKCQVRLF